MPDYRTMYDNEYLYAFDLQGRDVLVTIDKVKAGQLVGEKGRKTKKPIVYFVGKEKGLAINKTNGKVIAAMYGTDCSKWEGKRVTLYPTTTEMAGQVVDCIRVRPVVPTEKENGK